MASPILTDGATFTCPHGGSGTVASGISISALASQVTIGGHRPIAAGAAITGFTKALGCTFQISGADAPCVSFTLPKPSEPFLTVGGHAVYTQADLAAIALVPSDGNKIFGLQINESQTSVLT